jgi:hypothetical protein
MFFDDWVTLNQSYALIYIWWGGHPCKESFKPSKLSLNLKSDSISRLIGLPDWAYRSDRLTGFIRSPLPHQF